MAETRAKFTCYSEQRDSYGQVTYILRPVTGGTPENEAFYKTSPNGEIKLTVKRDETSAHFELGVDYYIDFTKASNA